MRQGLWFACQGRCGLPLVHWLFVFLALQTSPADVISALSYNQAFSLAYDSLTWLTPFLPRIQADIEISL